MRALAEAWALTRRFGEITALEDASFAVAPGEVVGLIGANGAGKTTAMRLLLGLLAPSAGGARLFDRPPSRSARARIGYVPQGLGLYDDLTVAENLRFAAAAYGVAARVPDDLAGASAVLVGDLPLGAQRRLAFAAALQHDPELLVLDEPTSGVDPLSRARLWERVREAAADGVGALVSTHYMDEARQCDRLVLLAAGRVVGQGTEADLVGHHRSVRVEAARWQDAFAALTDAGLPVNLDGRTVRVPGGDPGAIGGLLGAGARVEEVPATLEEVMVDLVAP